MNEKYLFRHSVGECPNCGNSNLNFNNTDYLLDGGVEYHFTCPNCGSVGKEVYVLSYLNSVVEVEDEQ